MPNTYTLAPIRGCRHSYKNDYGAPDEGRRTGGKFLSLSHCIFRAWIETNGASTVGAFVDSFFLNPEDGAR